METRTEINALKVQVYDILAEMDQARVILAQKAQAVSDINAKIAELEAKAIEGPTARMPRNEQ